MRKVIMAGFALATISGAHASSHHTTHHLVEKKTVLVKRYTNLHGVASFYGKGFWGRKTASGKIMKHGDMTVAHKTLPLGAKIRVLNEDNGKSVIVTVNDRGPYVGHRILDLAERPARLLDMEHVGLAHVRISLISLPKKEVEVAQFEPRKKVRRAPS